MEDRVRLRGGEQQALIDIMACTDRIAMTLDKGSLDRRLSGIGGGKRLKTARTNLLHLTEDLLDTVPAEQLKHLQRNLKGMKWHIYIGAIPPDKDSMEGRFLNIRELNTVASAISEVCKFCPHDNKIDQRRCPYKKLMDKLPADPVVERSDGECEWYLTFAQAGEE